MTLSRQLMVAVILLSVVLYSVSIYVGISNSRALVGQQMRAHAQDAAVILGTALAPAVLNSDRTSLERLLDDIATSDYFSRITLQNLTGQLILERGFPPDGDFSPKGNTVPSWFIALIDLPVYQAKAAVAYDEEPLGTITVTGRQGAAYEKLWRTLLIQLIWLAGVTLLACLFAILGLRELLRPLRRIENQANDIVEHRFAIQSELPKDRDLRSVVVAMNRMSSRLNQLFSEQSSLIGKLREEATSDPITGLANRAAFDARLTAFVEPENGPRAGAVFIIAVADVLSINDYAGREECNSILTNVGGVLSHVLQDYPQSLVARRQGADFAVLLPDVELGEAERLAKEAFEQVKGVTWQHQESRPLVFHMGFTHSVAIETPQTLLEEADIALKKAISCGSNQWATFADVSAGDVPVLKKPTSEWHDYLEKCLAGGDIELHTQPIFNIPEKSQTAAEAFARFRAGDHLLSTGVVIPVAEKLGLMVSLEKLIVEQAIEQRSVMDSDLIVNLSTASLRSEDFLAWLDKRLKALPKAKRPSFEVAEHNMHTSIVQVEALNKILFKHGCKLGVDHFGLETSSFAYLSRLSLSYLKAHRCFTANVHDNADNQFYLQMLGNLARSLDIQLWVEGVEQQQEFDMLCNIGVDAAQGYLLGAPVGILEKASNIIPAPKN